MTDTKALIEEARAWTERDADDLPQNLRRLTRELAGALEAAEQEAEITGHRVRDLENAITRRHEEARAAERRAEEAPCHHQNAAYLRIMAERDALAAVVEKARRRCEAGGWPVVSDMYTILSSAPTDALREHDARVWDEGFDAGERDVMEHKTFDEPCIPNPYRREEQDA